MVKIILLILLAHIIDDFVLQPVCLSQLKCKSWWIEECNKNNVKFEKYQTDYVVGLIMHAASWSIMILLPIMLLMNVDDWLLLKLFLINMAIHAIVDDFKANRYKINLWTNQFIHIWQIIITFYLVTFNPTLI